MYLLPTSEGLLSYHDGTFALLLDPALDSNRITTTLTHEKNAFNQLN